ncbi:MAG: M16 family metallopeptidase [Candidatus Aminicenantales bacterium]
MKNRTMKMTLFVLAAEVVLMSCGKTAGPDQLTTELLPVPDNPLISFRILINVGSAEDPTGKDGLSRLTWSLLAEGGSRLRSAEEISRAFFPMAASVSLGLDKEMAVFSATVHKDNLRAFYEILKDMLLDPGFRADDFERLKAIQLAFVEKILIGNMDEQFGKEILNLMIYDGHPFGRNDSGTVESIGGMTLEDAKEFYRQNFVRGNIVIGLAGGYPEGFPAQVLEDFEKLPAGFTPRIPLPEPRTPRGFEFVLAEKDTPGTAISMGFPIALTKADGDFFALWIAGSHFGEHRQHVSLLFQKIREERGQNYGDYAYIEHFVQGRDKFPAPNHARRQQYFSIWLRPLPNANRHFVIRQALRELRRLVDEGISEERFQLVRTYLLNYTKLYAQTLSERLGWRMDSRFYGYDDFLAEAAKVLPTLTRADVNAAIKKYLQAENVEIAVITPNAAALKDDLAAGRPSPIRYANPNMPAGILEEDRVIQVYPLAVNPENIRIVPAAEFFKKSGIPGR